MKNFLKSAAPAVTAFLFLAFFIVVLIPLMIKLMDLWSGYLDKVLP